MRCGRKDAEGVLDGVVTLVAELQRWRVVLRTEAVVAVPFHEFKVETQIDLSSGYDGCVKCT